MSDLYVSIAISELPPGTDRGPLASEVLPHPLRINSKTSLQQGLIECSWTTQEERTRFQINHMALITRHAFESHQAWHRAYEALVHSFVDAAKPLLWVNNWESTFFSYADVLYPLRGERRLYPPGRSMSGDEHERLSDLKLTSGLQPEDAARLSAEELDFVIRCRRYPLRALAERRLADLAGWLVYLGPELVATYGQEKLASLPGSDLVQDKRGGCFLYLKSSVTMETYRPGVMTGRPSWVVYKRAREHLGIDASWYVRYNELRNKARGVPWSRENLRF